MSTSTIAHYQHPQHQRMTADLSICANTRNPDHCMALLITWAPDPATHRFGLTGEYHIEKVSRGVEVFDYDPESPEPTSYATGKEAVTALLRSHGFTA